MISVYFLAYLIFFSALGIANLFIKEPNARAVFYSLGGALTFVGFGLMMMIAATPKSHGGVSFGPPPAVLVLPLMGLAGAGLFTSALLNTLQGKRVMQSLVMTIVLVVPIGLGATKHFLEQARIEKAEEFRAEMELTNVSGTLGDYPVKLPISPMVSIEARCDEPTGTNRSYCNARFGRPNAFEYFVGFGSDTLEFLVIRVSLPNCAKEDCARFRSWCDRRPALKESAWCWFDKKVSIEMRVDEIRPNEEDTYSPLLVQSSPVDGLRIRCARYYGSVRHCNAHYELRPGVRVKLGVRTEPGTEERKVREARSDVEQLWTAMTRID